MRIRAEKTIKNNDIDYLCRLMEEGKLNRIRNIGKKDIEEVKKYLIEYLRNMMNFHNRRGN